MTDNDPISELEQDRAELARALRRHVAADARRAPDPEPASVVARGRSLRRRRRAGALAVLVSISVTAVVAGPRIAPAFRSTAGETGPAGAAPEDMPAEAATFAIRAVAAAGLMNPLDDYYGYRSTERAGVDSWRVMFASAKCSRDAHQETCTGGSGEDARGNAIVDTELDVSVVDGEWRVTKADGPMDADALSELLGFRRHATATDPHPEYAPVILSEPLSEQNDGAGLDVRVASYWAGPLPDPRITFACYLVVFDENGNVVHETQAHAYESPNAESERGGWSMMTGLPPDVDAARAEMRCYRFTGPGWELVEQPTLMAHDGGRSVTVHGEVTWRERAVAAVDLDCSVRLLNAAGEIVGDRTYPMAGPWAPDDDPPFTRDLDVIVDVPGAEPVASVDFSCRVPEPPMKPPNDEGSGGDGDGGDHDAAPTPRPPMPSPPEGPRTVIAQGRFEGPDWGDYAGLGWQLQAWENDEFRCFRFAVDPHLDDLDGRGCTQLPTVAEEDLRGGGVVPADAFNGELSIAYGELSTRVDRVRFDSSTGETTTVDALVPPGDAGIDARYYVAFLQPSESFDLSALDAEGLVLESHH